MTMTDGERAIIAQLKRIADNLDKLTPTPEMDFGSVPLDPDVARRFSEPRVSPQPWMEILRVFPTYTVTGTPGDTTNTVKVQYVPTESTNGVWERIMREGEGEHLLNPDADHTGEDVE